MRLCRTDSGTPSIFSWSRGPPDSRRRVRLKARTQSDQSRRRAKPCGLIRWNGKCAGGELKALVRCPRNHLGPKAEEVARGTESCLLLGSPPGASPRSGHPHSSLSSSAHRILGARHPPEQERLKHHTHTRTPSHRLGSVVSVQGYLQRLPLPSFLSPSSPGPSHILSLRFIHLASATRSPIRVEAQTRSPRILFAKIPRIPTPALRFVSAFLVDRPRPIDKLQPAAFTHKFSRHYGRREFRLFLLIISVSLSLPRERPRRYLQPPDLPRIAP